MIDRIEEREIFTILKVSRYPKPILLIGRGTETIGQITIKDDFEEELWKEAIKLINHLQTLKKN